MRIRRAWVLPGAVAAVALAVAGGVVALKAGPPTASSPAAIGTQTATVTRTRLSTTETLGGTLGYGAAQTLSGSQTGIVTWLPASGAVVSRGQPLYRVNNEPVPLFYGGTPLYRRLDAAGMVGPDVKVVADNLAALGYDIGYQPPVGSVITQASPAAARSAAPLAVSATVLAATVSTSSASGSPSPSAASSYPAAGLPATTPSPGPPASGPVPSGTSVGKFATPAASGTGTACKPTPTPTPTPSDATPVTATVGPGDAVLTAALRQAIGRWQMAVGLPATGILGVGDVLVEPGPVRVTAIAAQLGDQASGQLMTVASTAKTVTVQVDSTDVLSVSRSGRVTIQLPDGSTIPGSITAVGTTVQSAQNTSDGQPQQAVTVAPRDPSAVASLTSAPVQVTFAGKTADGVLAVPVTALLALSGGGYALQLPSGRLIGVQVGLFAQGLVQVSGPGITAGLQVVTSQ